MTLKEIYNIGRKKLAGTEIPLSDCSCLAEEFLGADRKEILLRGDRQVDEEKAEEFLRAVEKRVERYPLQYILGYWYFCDMKLTVKDGVLCPREDTEILVRTAAEFIGNEGYRGIDLCSGTGAVALGIAEMCPKAKITAAELYHVPFQCLAENTEKYGGGRVAPMRGDILEASTAEKFSQLDFLVSNPPYIESGELPELQEEVRREPEAALDGGSDGLVFYREIIKLWSSCIRPGGLMAFEIGESQGEAVSRLMEKDFRDIKVIKDMAGLDRVVCGIKR